MDACSSSIWFSAKHTISTSDKSVIISFSASDSLFVLSAACDFYSKVTFMVKCIDARNFTTVASFLVASYLYLFCMHKHTHRLGCAIITSFNHTVMYQYCESHQQCNLLYIWSYTTVNTHCILVVCWNTGHSALLWWKLFVYGGDVHWQCIYLQTLTHYYYVFVAFSICWTWSNAHKYPFCKVDLSNTDITHHISHTSLWHSHVYTCWSIYLCTCHFLDM